MKIIKFLVAIFLVGTIALTGCRPAPYDGPNRFFLNITGDFLGEIEDVELEGDTLFLGDFNGDRRLLAIDVGLEVPVDHWEAVTPTADDWIVLARHGDRIHLSVGENKIPISENGEYRYRLRKSWFEFSVGENTRRIHVHQDYSRYIEFAIGSEHNVGAPSGSANLEVITNVVWENIDVSFENHEAIEWIDQNSISFSLEDGRLRFEYNENPSLYDMRHFTITLSGEGTSQSLAVSQNQLSGEPYVIDLRGLTFVDSYVYEIWDPINQIVVGKLALEYLHRHNPADADPIVRMRTIVVYPMTADGSRVNLSGGLVVETGRHITWFPNVTNSTVPHEILAVYEHGETIDPSLPMTVINLREQPHQITIPSAIYLARGASRMNISGSGVLDLPEELRVHAELRPFVLRDVRTGPANNHGQTHEDFTYGVVKIGTQFWTRENLRTTRWSDNNENIPTGWAMLEEGRWGDPMGDGPWTAASGDPLTGPGASISWLNGMFPAAHLGMRTHSIGVVPERININQRDANTLDPDTVALRMHYGVLYNFHAMTRTRGIFHQQIPADQIVDRLSPQNSPWRIPYRYEFWIMARYAYQFHFGGPGMPQNHTPAPERLGGRDGKLSGYTAERYPDSPVRGHASNITGFTGIGNVSRSNTITGTNGGTMFLAIDGYRWRGGQFTAFQQHWMDFFAIETQNSPEVGHFPLQRAGQSTHRTKYVRLILDL